ncbi:MAG TPA: TetR/AcrR family transcriptional regulator [Candidatus Binatia bacterium]|nr:TetR/AcrR family transcriptional regulator [Candidatus Binatia bacterium]
MARKKPAARGSKQTLREESILQAAAACFGEQGYRATTLETVAERLGISRVTLYRYCPSKEELLIRVFERSIAIFQRGLQQICAQEVPPEEKLRQIIRHQIHLMAEHRNFLSVFFSEEGNLPPEMARRARTERRVYDELIEGVIREGIEAKRLAPLPPKLLSFALLGMCNWLYQWYQPEGPLSADEVARIFIVLVEHGYLHNDPQQEILSRLEQVETALTELRQHLTSLTSPTSPQPMHMHSERNS